MQSEIGVVLRLSALVERDLISLVVERACVYGVHNAAMIEREGVLSEDSEVDLEEVGAEEEVDEWDIEEWWKEEAEEEEVFSGGYGCM